MDLLARESEDIGAMIVRGDIDGLIQMLAQGQWDSKILTANGLAMMGDERALQPLAAVRPVWIGDSQENPLDLAIAAIQARFATPAVALVDTNDVLPHYVEQWQVLKAPVVDPNVLCGIVIDRAGAAIAHARVVLHFEHTKWGFGNYQVAEVLSDANGFYCFPEEVGLETPLLRRFAGNRYMLLASHADYALGWSLIPTQSQSLAGFYDITLTEPVTRAVQVMDINDTPIVGAWVWPYSFGDRESPDPVFRDYLFLSTDLGLVGGKTDQEGWAVITHLPDTNLSYHATLAGYADGLTFHAGHPIRLNLGGTVKGRIESAQGQGIQGAMVVFYSDWGHHGYWLAQTDAAGDFVLEDLPTRGWDCTPWGETEGGNGAYVVTLEHPEVTMPETRIVLEPGQVMEDWTLTAFAETVLIECLVLAADTNEPVAGAKVRVGSNPMGETSGNTDANGVFTCQVLPGQTSLSVPSPPKGHYTLPEQNPSESYQRFQASGSQMQVTIKSAPLAGTLISVHGTILNLEEIQGEGSVKIHANAGKEFRTAAMTCIRSVSSEPSGLFEL
ncbi:MAG: carboxypeptidase regulatory-like domain-containing protein, partial [Planctomycetes bacterium]|nr:carboxypeptidase regulatory-like domain-containing protein [Planctomycetota bacterium]